MAPKSKRFHVCVLHPGVFIWRCDEEPHRPAMELEPCMLTSCVRRQMLGPKVLAHLGAELRSACEVTLSLQVDKIKITTPGA